MKLVYQILLKSTPKLTGWIRPWPQLRLVECSVMICLLSYACYDYNTRAVGSTSKI